jgi:hypothetical protein
MMRKLVSLALGSTAIVALACGKSKSNATAVNDDLKRDLQLATQSQAIQISPDEISPRHQEMAVKPKAPDGPRTTRKEHPTRWRRRHQSKPPRSRRSYLPRKIWHHSDVTVAVRDTIARRAAACSAVTSARSALPVGRPDGRTAGPASPFSAGSSAR